MVCSASQTGDRKLLCKMSLLESDLREYKVVRMVQFHDQDTGSCDKEVQVYSLKPNAWKRAPEFPRYINYCRSWGCLRFLVCSHSRFQVDVWVMKPYGIKESWLKLFSLKKSKVCRGLHHLAPLARSDSSSNQVFLCRAKIFCCMT
ncbi:F-box protein [Quillaja saponaria]|uniref:F-box protein n=1 Tax=Quillaja saponaria TaxID=32244 RepID=A0AAD7PIU6_QUISA|nr:F-box protein [Quillaja saponaria]